MTFVGVVATRGDFVATVIFVASPGSLVTFVSFVARPEPSWPP